MHCVAFWLSLITRAPPTTKITIRLRVGLDWGLSSLLIRIAPQPARSKTLISYYPYRSSNFTEGA